MPNPEVLEQFDLVACPAGVYHYYKNVDPSKEERQILTILPGAPTVRPLVCGRPVNVDGLPVVPIESLAGKWNVGFTDVTSIRRRTT